MTTKDFGNQTPKGFRCVITLAGRRNAGKSSLINAICEQDIAIVSATAGTTTDPVAKPYELLPFGPVTFYDTAGLDDIGEVGEKRIKATRKILYRSDLVLVISDENGLDNIEKNLILELKNAGAAFLVIFNKSDIKQPRDADINFCRTNNLPYEIVSTFDKQAILKLKTKIIDTIPYEMKEEPVLIADIIKKDDVVLCVIPIDSSAPKGRIILPQVQIIREVLDCSGLALSVKETEITSALASLKNPPKLVITDTQAIKLVNQLVPNNIALTTFSTVFARLKGDFKALVDGAKAIDTLEDGDKVLVAEACSHHVQDDDIGRYKIPNWIKEYTGKKVDFELYAGHDFPEDLEKYQLVIHCGACMTNRAEVMRRIRECRSRNVPITNYGIAISKTQGVLDRVIKPFV